MQDNARRDGPHLHDLQDEIWFKTTSRQDCDAAEHAQRLKAELDANQQAATQRHSRAILVALRTGSPPPVAETPVAADTAALTAALAHHDAMELAYRELAAEAGEAHNVAHAAAVAADWIIEDILDAEGRELASEVIATQHEHWRKFDLLVGLIRLDESRTKPQLRVVQAPPRRASSASAASSACTMAETSLARSLRSTSSTGATEDVLLVAASLDRVSGDGEE